MRRTLTACRTGLSVAAALVLLTACGGSGDDDTAASTSSSSSSAAETTAAEATDGEFCTQATALLGQVTPALTSTGDPTTLAPTLAQAAADAQAIEPPESIADDWTALTDGLDQFATAAGAVNANDPAAAAQLAQLKAQLLTQLAGPATNVQTFLGQECGLPAAPTS